jgi:hypothetical protein
LPALSLEGLRTPRQTAVRAADLAVLCMGASVLIWHSTRITNILRFASDGERLLSQPTSERATTSLLYIILVRVFYIYS